jgi:hypothetical protein
LKDFIPKTGKEAAAAVHTVLKLKYYGKIDMSKNIFTRLAQIAESIDEKAMEPGVSFEQSKEMLELSDEISNIISSIDDDDVVQAEESEEPKISETESPVAKLSNKDKTALKGFYRAASKLVDRVSVGRKEFPNREQRVAMNKIISSIDDNLDSLEEYNIVSKKDVVSASKAPKGELEARLYKSLIASGHSKKSLVAENVIEAEEAEYLEELMKELKTESSQ